MSEDSQRFLEGLEQVAKQVSQKYPGFYDLERERESVRREFGKEYIGTYASTIARYMDAVQVTVTPIAKKHRFFGAKEFVEFLKLIGEYKEFDLLSGRHRRCLYGQFVGWFMNKVRDYSCVKDIKGHKRKFEGEDERYEKVQKRYYQYHSKRARDIAQRALFALLKLLCKYDEKELELLEKCFGKNGEYLEYKTVSDLAESEDQEVKEFIHKFFDRGVDNFQVSVHVKNEEKGCWNRKSDVLHCGDVWVLKSDVIKEVVLGEYFPQCISRQQLEEFAAQQVEYLVGYELMLKDTIDDQIISGLRLWTTPDFDVTLRDKIARRMAVELFVSKKLFAALGVNIDYNPKIRVSMRDFWKKEDKEMNVHLWGTGNLDVHLLPGRLKKKFPERNEIFRAVHANSAVCYSMQDLLIMFRKEEILKTVLHEMNHQIGVGSDNFSRWLGENFAIEKTGQRGFGDTFLMNEVVAESMACITNVIMTAYETDPNNFLQTVIQMFEREKLFSIYQAAKILYLSGFDSFEQFYYPKKGGPRIKQAAAVAEYHILKAACIHDINGLLEIFMDPENKDVGKRGWRSIGRARRNTKLKRYLLRNIRDWGCVFFKNKVNTLLQAFNNGVLSCTHDDDLFATGRMTIIEPMI